MRKCGSILIVILSGCLLFSLTSGGFLVVNNPQHADAIVVLAGETFRRPNRGLQLLAQNYAPKMLLDVPADGNDLRPAMRSTWRRLISSNFRKAKKLAVCPIYGLSTKTEAQDVNDDASSPWEPAAFWWSHPITILAEL